MSVTHKARAKQLPMRAAGFTDPAFERLADLAHVLAGLVFPPNRQPSAEAGMRRAMTTLRIAEPHLLLRAAETPGAARDAVLAELTVGESYFFRDSAQLEILATEILSARFASQDVSRPFRVWSAGCASGEEPYTMAILLRELASPHAARITGTDVALPRLEAARRGRYTRWALRGVSEDRIAKWFHRRGNYFDLDPDVRESVEFRALNLVHDDYGSANGGTGVYDLVLCRNVMIYFNLHTVTRIATGLLASLAPDGWLVLGPSDPPLAELVPCEVVITTAGIAYRRAGRHGASPKPRRYDRAEPPRDVETETPPILESVRAAPASVAPAPSVPRSSRDGLLAPTDECSDVVGLEDVIAAYERADYPAAEAMADTALACAGEGQGTLPLWVYHIRAVANQGRLHEAGELCARALETHPLTAELHYLHATLLAEAGWQSDAAIAARRSIYLDRKFVMGHLLLGDALTRTGDASGARIAFENVVALLADMAPGDPVMAADGVPASRLRQIATLRLRDLAVTERR